MNFYIKSTKKCLVAPYCSKSARTLSKNKIRFSLAYIETNGGYFSFHIAWYLEIIKLILNNIDLLIESFIKIDSIGTFDDFIMWDDKAKLIIVKK